MGDITLIGTPGAVSAIVDGVHNSTLAFTSMRVHKRACAHHVLKAPVASEALSCCSPQAD